MPEAAPMPHSPIASEPNPQKPDLGEYTNQIDQDLVCRAYEKLKPDWKKSLEDLMQRHQEDTFEKRSIATLVSYIEAFLSGDDNVDGKTISALFPTYQEISEALNLQEINGRVSLAQSNGAELYMSFEHGKPVRSEQDPNINDPQKSRVPEIILTVEHKTP